MWNVKRGVEAMKVVKMLKYLVVVSVLGMMVIPSRSFGYSADEAEDKTQSARETWIRDVSVLDADITALKHVVSELKARSTTSLNEVQRVELEIAIAEKEIQLEKKKLEKLALDKTYYEALKSIKENVTASDYHNLHRNIKNILESAASARVVDGEDITFRHRVQDLLVSQKERELSLLQSRKRELEARVGIETGLRSNVSKKSEHIQILCDLIDSLFGTLEKVEEESHKMHFIYGLLDGKPLPQALGESSQFRLQFAYEQAQGFYEQARDLYKEAQEEEDKDKLKAAVRLKQLGDESMMAIYMQQYGPGMIGGNLPSMQSAMGLSGMGAMGGMQMLGMPGMGGFGGSMGGAAFNPAMMGGMSQMQQGSLANMLPFLMQGGAMGGGMGGMQMPGMPGMGGFGGMNPAMSMTYNPYQTGNQWDFSTGGPVGDGYFPGQFGANFSNNGMGGGGINLMYAPENKQLNNVMDRYIEQNPQQYPYGYPGYMQNFNSGMFGPG